jgi:hypothetical protein
MLPRQARMVIAFSTCKFYNDYKIFGIGRLPVFFESQMYFIRLFLIWHFNLKVLFRGKDGTEKEKQNTTGSCKHK